MQPSLSVSGRTPARARHQVVNVRCHREQHVLVEPAQGFQDGALSEAEDRYALGLLGPGRLTPYRSQGPRRPTPARPNLAGLLTARNTVPVRCGVRVDVTVAENLDRVAVPPRLGRTAHLSLTEPVLLRHATAVTEGVGGRRPTVGARPRRNPFV